MNKKKHHVERHDKRRDVRESLRNPEDSYYKCGSKGHWSRVYRTPEHLYNIFKASLKGKKKEVNFTEHDDPMMTQLILMLQILLKILLIFQPIMILRILVIIRHDCIIIFYYL